MIGLEELIRIHRTNSTLHESILSLLRLEDEVRGELSPMFRGVLDSVAGLSAGLALDRLAVALDLDRARLGTIAVESTIWARRHVGNLIVDINQAQREAIRELVVRANVENIAPRELSVLVRGVVGLTGKQAEQLASFRAGLVEQSVEGAQLASRVEKFGDAL